MSRKSAFVASILVALALVLAGSTLAYQEFSVVDGGTISGTVKFVGSAPKLEPVKVVKDQRVCGNEVPSEVLLVNAQNKGLKNAVVFIERIEKGKQVEAKEPLLGNKECLFVPHVQVVPVPVELQVKNDDPVLHNTHTFLESVTVFNLALPIQGQVIKRKVMKPGVIRVQCDAHVHMSAWIVAVPHPYFAVTDENGGFKIDNVPPGKHRIVAWHEPWQIKGKDRAGRPLYDPLGVVKLAQEVTVPGKGEVKVSFEFK